MKNSNSLLNVTIDSLQVVLKNSITLFVLKRTYEVDLVNAVKLAIEEYAQEDKEIDFDIIWVAESYMETHLLGERDTAYALSEVFDAIIDCAK